jgi:TetR/AcrR family transcriptional repressor of nem operon
MTPLIHNGDMRKSKDDKAKSHERIVEVAAARVREAGVDGPGVAEIMSAAGLTHGGFYKHFASRDELVAEALDSALAEGRRKMAEVTDGASDPLAKFVSWYLSPEHVDNPAAGCAVAALASEMPRSNPELRHAFTQQTEHYLETLERLLGDEGSREQAAAALAALVGGLILARAVDDPGLSRELLRDVRDSIAG